MTYTPEQLQRARDIVADAYIAHQLADAAGFIARSHNGSFEEFGRHVDSYSRFLRQGAYDNDIAVQAALMALTEAQREAA